MCGVNDKAFGGCQTDGVMREAMYLPLYAHWRWIVRLISSIPCCRSGTDIRTAVTIANPSSVSPSLSSVDLRAQTIPLRFHSQQVAFFLAVYCNSMSVYSFQCQITHYEVCSFCARHTSKNSSYISLTNQTKLWCISNQCHWAQTSASFRMGWGSMSYVYFFLSDAESTRLYMKII